MAKQEKFRAETPQLKGLKVLGKISLEDTRGGAKVYKGRTQNMNVKNRERKLEKQRKQREAEAQAKKQAEQEKRQAEQEKRQAAQDAYVNARKVEKGVAKLQRLWHNRH